MVMCSTIINRDNNWHDTKAIVVDGNAEPLWSLCHDTVGGEKVSKVVGLQEVPS